MFCLAEVSSYVDVLTVVSSGGTCVDRTGESLKGMIFGFNTDIRHQDTVYHVQSEAREGEQLLQTQVFVKGRCIGKRAVPYGSSTSPGSAAAAAPSDQDK